MSFALGVAALRALAPPARAEDAATEDTGGPLGDCEGAWDPGSAGALALSWRSETEGVLDPTLLLTTPDALDARYRLEGRVRFRGEELTWEQDLGALDPATPFEVDLDTDALLSGSDAQEAWASDLRVVAVATDADGVELTRTRSQEARLVFLDGQPLLLTTAAAAELAPSGAWSDEALASLPEAEVGWVLEVGGASGIESDGPLAEEE